MNVKQALGKCCHPSGCEEDAKYMALEENDVLSQLIGDRWRVIGSCESHAPEVRTHSNLIAIQTYKGESREEVKDWASLTYGSADA